MKKITTNNEEEHIMKSTYTFAEKKIKYKIRII